MLSKKDIDQLEGYLCNATLNELPNILMKILPLMFAELRTMEEALNNQAQEFFLGTQRDDGRGRVATGLTSGAGAGVLRGAEKNAEPSAARAADHVHAVPQGSPQRQDEADPRGLSGAEGVGPVPVGHGGMGSPLGGEVRNEAGHGPESGSQQDVAVKKRRGRPRKVLTDSNTTTEGAK